MTGNFVNKTIYDLESPAQINADDLILVGKSDGSGLIAAKASRLASLNPVGPTGPQGATGPAGITGPTGSGGGGGYSEVTHSELLDLIDTNDLVPGGYYLITDFRTCYDRPNYDKYKNPIPVSNDSYVSETTEPILVFAISSNTLSVDAYSPSYPNDKLKYDVTYSVTESGNPAFGRITERIDEFGNRTDYDHRTITFKRYLLRTYNRLSPLQGTVEILSGGVITGTSTNFTSLFPGQIIAIRNSNETFYEIVSIDDDTTMTVSGETISQTFSGGYQFFTSNDYSYDSYYSNNIDGQLDFQLYNTFEAATDDGCINTYIGDHSKYYLNEGIGDFLLANNVLKDGLYENNTIGDSSYNNTFNDDCTANQIGYGFRNNITDDDFDENVIGTFFENNIITSNFYDNHIGNDFNDNIIICSSFWRNQIGNDYKNNWLDGDWGFEFQNNQIGNQFNNNQIYKAFYKNFVLNGYNDNTTWDEYVGNKVGNGFNNNTIYCQLYDNQILDYFENNNLGDPNSIGSYSFYNNMISNSFQNNTITGSCYNNVIGNNFISNTIGTDFSYNTIVNGFSSNTVVDNFQFNDVKYTLSSTDFTSATHVYGYYNCTLFLNAISVSRLSYYDSVDVLTITDINL
jgi:hypothetical protein